MFDLTNCRFAFLDFETTGLSPWFGDRICEIGIVLTEGKRIRDTYRTLVNPGRELSPAAASTNGLTDAELAAAPPFEDVADELSAYLRDAVVVCHNARFDLQFLDSEFQRMERELQIPNLIDTLFIAREYFELPSNSLRAVAEDFGIVMDEERHALADALICRGVFFEMMAAIQPTDGKPDEFIGIYNSPAWPSDGIQLPVELNEAIQSGKRLHITYVDGKEKRSQRSITPQQVIGLSDYLYLQAHCHLRNAERSFRLDRITEIGIEDCMGALLLEGGAEFGGAMREPDLCAIEMAGGLDAPIRIIPTAAAPDKNHLRAGNNGIRWFLSLGATNVEPVLLINEESANDPEIIETLRGAKLIYMLGGFTHYLGQTLLGSKAWEAVLDAYRDGAVIAGSSAGAMVMCEYYFDPGRGKVEKCLNLLPNACVLPHHNTFGKGWAEKVKTLLPGVTLLGIDEYTGMLTGGAAWQVLGGGAVTVYHGEDVMRYESGQRFVLK